MDRIFESGLAGSRLTVLWHAGEPLTVPQAFYERAVELVEAAQARHGRCDCQVRHSMQTNGTLIDARWCRFFQKHNFEIGVSLDGPAFVHDLHRKTRSRQGSHAAAMRGVRELQANKIDFGVIAVLTLQSLDHPDAIFTFFLENGIGRVGFNVEEIEGENRESSLAGGAAEARFRRFLARFLELCESSDGAVSVREFNRVRSLILGGGRIKTGQFTPFSIISVDHSGEFTTFSPELLSMPSDLYTGFAIGNVQTTSFEAAAQSPKFRRMAADVAAGVEHCRKTCQYFSLCGGGAPANKWYENGTFRSAETMYCRLAHKVPADLVLEELERQAGLA